MSHNLVEFREARDQDFQGEYRYYCSKCRLSFKNRSQNGNGCHPRREIREISYPPELRNVLKILDCLVQRTFNSMEIRFWKFEGQHPRYLIWLQWSRMLDVPFENLVRMIIKEYRERLRLSGPALGVSLPALTGPRVQEWVFSQKSQRSESLQELSSRKNYQSSDEYAAHIDDLRRMERQRSKAYRGSRSWVKPKEDKDAVLEVLRQCH